MRTTESLRFAVRGILANKMRSMLTTLMILIGVASVISLVAVGTGSSRDVQESISRLGSNTLYVLPDLPTGRGGTGLAAQMRRAMGIPAPSVSGTQTRSAILTYADAEAIGKLPSVGNVAPGSVMRGVALQYQSAATTSALLIGSTPAFLDIDETEIAVGQPFTDADYTAHARKILIGKTVANNLGGQDPTQLVGQEVRINGSAFTVVGIMGPKGYSGQRDLDDRIIAVGTAVNDALYGYSPQGLGPVNGIAVSAKTPDLVSTVQLETTELLAQRHGVSLINADFIVFNASSILDASSDSNKTLSILLAAVAGISLLVGGIGVMNIMLVSVTERTREIGIRKAIGADRKDIVGQFLGEAVMLSLAGGILGVGAGFIAVQWRIAGVEPVIAPYSVYLALGVSLMTGLVFGLYPASRAAELRPIDALRYE